MVDVTVKFMGIARQRAGVSKVEFVCEGRKLRDVLSAVAAAYGVADIILTECGEVRPWARVLVNGRSHEFMGGLNAELHNGDSLALIYPYTENF